MIIFMYSLIAYGEGLQNGGGEGVGGGGLPRQKGVWGVTKFSQAKRRGGGTKCFEVVLMWDS